MKFISKRLATLRMKFVLPSIGFIALVVLSSFVFFGTTKTTVVFAKNGEEETIETDAKTVAELLDELNIEVGEHDFVSVRLDEDIHEGLTIEYDEAKRVYITIDDTTNEHYTTEETVGDFLEEKNITVSGRDDISHGINQKVFDDLHVTIQQAFKVVIDDGGDESNIWSTGDTVENLLKEHDIQLNDEDMVEPELDEEIKEEQSVSITRVDKEVETVEETVAYQTETQNDDSLDKGKEKTVTQGEEGTRVKKFEVTYENGEEIARELVEEEISTQPVNQVVAIGTKEEQPKQNLKTLSSSGSNDDDGEPSGEVHHMTATAYTMDCNGCSGNGYTATGINLKENPDVVAVDPDKIPLGSKVWVEDYGYAVAGDTGGAIKDNRIDLHVSSKSEASNYGFQKVKVIVVD